MATDTRDLALTLQPEGHRYSTSRDLTQVCGGTPDEQLIDDRYSCNEYIQRSSEPSSMSGPLKVEWDLERPTSSVPVSSSSLFRCP